MRLIFSVLFLLFASQASGQNIAGLWQISDTQVGSNCQQHYIFSIGKKFTYNTSGYDGLQRVMTIGGHYNLASKVLYLTPEYTVEMVGGVVERSRNATLNDSWSIEKGRLKVFKIAKPIRQAVKFKMTKSKKGPCVLLDGRPYYKIMAVGK